MLQKLQFRINFALINQYSHMKNSVFLAMKKMAVVLTVILAGFGFVNKTQAQADFTAFNLALSPSFTEIKSLSDTTITVPVYNTADVNSIAAIFTVSAGATVTVNGLAQVSGTTRNNYTSTVVYRVSNGTAVKNWKVSIQRKLPSLERQLLTFSLPLPGGTSAVGTINETLSTVSVVVPLTLNVTALAATFTVSPIAIVKVNNLIQTSGVTTNNFGNPVSYVVQAENGSTHVYIVSIVRDVAQHGKQLVTFGFNALSPAVSGTIDETLHTVALTVPYAVNRATLVATFTTSLMATVKIGSATQVSGITVNDFSGVNPVVYTVVAEDGLTQDYAVTVSRVAPSSAKDFVTFKFSNLTPNVNGTVDATLGTITAIIPYASNITTLIATFTTSPLVQSVKIGTTSQVSGTTVNDFTSPVTYTITAEDGTSRTFVVSVTKTAASTAKSILTFDFVVGVDPDVIGTVSESNLTITLYVAYSQNITALIPTFTSSPLSVLKQFTNGVDVPLTSGVTPINFTNPVSIKCIAEDGLSINVYTVSVIRNLPSTMNQLLTFTFNGLNSNLSDVDATGTINQTAQTVTIHVPFGTPVTAVVATFTLSSYATARVGGTSATTGILQVSGNTWNNFTSPVQYRIYAEDALSVQVYTVTVIVDPNTEKKLLTFSFSGLTPPITGTIDETAHTVQVAIAATTSHTNLIATFTQSVNATVLLDGTAQVSGVTANDFTLPRSYVVKAQDNTTQVYLVTVTHNTPSTANLIGTFSFNALTPPVVATVNQTLNTITAVLPFGTSRTTLVAAFTNSYYSSVTVNGVNQTSGLTVNDFTNPVTYRCTSESGSPHDYVVTITVTPGSSAKDITYFAFEDLNPDVVCTINQSTLNITGTVPNGTNRGALRAFFTNSALSTVRVANMGIQQSGITVNDFRVPISYEVTAQDGSIKSYVVNIFEAPDTTKPVVSNTNQTVSNLAGQYVILRSNEASGKVYIISNSASQTTVADLEASVAAKLGRSAYVNAANADIPISTANMAEGNYNTYAIDAAGNKSAMGINRITIIDRLPPTVSVDAQTVTNSLNKTVAITSSKNGIVYLILEGVPQGSKSDLDAAVTAKHGAKGLVLSPNTPVAVSVYQLAPGNYHAYSVDISLANNMSAPSTNIVVVTEASRIKSILSYSFNQLDPPAIGQIVGTDINVVVRVGTPITNLVATFIISPLSQVHVGLTPQVSGITPNDFTSPVHYIVTAEDGSSLVYTVTVEYNTGIEESDWLTSIKSYPNPVSNSLNIESQLPLNQVVIMNSVGQVIEDIRNSGQTTIQVQTDSWMKGMYFIRYYCEKKFIGVQKIIKN